VLHLAVAAAFEDVHEADQVAVDVGMRVLQRIAHAGLGGQVDHAVEAFSAANSASMPARSATSSFTKRKPAGGCSRASRSSFSADVVVVVEVVEADHLVAARQQAQAVVHADEPGTTSNQDFHFLVSVSEEANAHEAGVMPELKPAAPVMRTFMRRVPWELGL
jgi:hypothetical protein